MKLGARLILSSYGSLLLLALLLPVLIWSLGDLQKERLKYNLATELRTLQFERSSLRNEYLLYHGERVKRQWFSSKESIDRILKEMAGVLTDADSRLLLDQMRGYFADTVTVFTQIVKKHDEATAGVITRSVASDIERRLSTQLIVKAKGLFDAASTLHERSAKKLEAAYHRTTMVVILFTLFTIITAINSFLVSRRLKQRITMLNEGAQAIADGNLDYRYQCPGEDELAELSRTVDSMTDKLQLNIRQLQAANNELDAFAYAVSHDLRAPLRAMNGFSQALIEDFGEVLTEEARDYLDQIVIASRHMGGLIDGLLTLSRSTRGELQLAPVDLSTLAGHIRDELERTEPQRRVTWQIEPNLCIRGDAAMVEVALRNLLANAWKYTANTVMPLIRVYLDESDGERFICISDNGAGFDMAHRARLFKPFQRLHRQDEFPGMGIGLATVERIMRRHGGDIVASAAPGEGATFRLAFPGA